MDGVTSDIDAQADAFLRKAFRVRRRQAPRVSDVLVDGEYRDVATPFGTVAAWRRGTGPATLFVHGWEDDNSLWAALMARFVEEGRSVVALDLPAHGYSQAEDPAMYSMMAAVKAVAKEFGPLDGVVAHCLGSMATIMAMDDGLDVPRAVFVAAILGRSVTLEGIAQHMGVAPEVAKRAVALFEERAGKPMEWFDPKRAAANMSAKVLFTHSLDDDTSPVTNTQTLSAIWPNAETAYTDGLGHRDIAHDASVIDRVMDFMRETDV